MTRPEKAYIPITYSIHKRRPGPFATWEISQDTGLHRNVIRRVLMRLRNLRYILMIPKGFAHRTWRVTKKGPENVQEGIEDYELHRLVSG